MIQFNFTYAFDTEENEQLVKDFENFFAMNRLDMLFTDSHKATDIRVSYIQARSIVGQGRDYDTFMIFSAITMNKAAFSNQMLDETRIKMLNVQTFDKLRMVVKEVNDIYFGGITTKQQDNIWNIVWYTKTIF